MLVGMYCIKEYRGHGISKAVLSDLMEKAYRLEGLELILLSVVSDNFRAKRFYEFFGFQVYDTEPMALFDGNRSYDEDLMYKKL